MKLVVRNETNPNTDSSIGLKVIVAKCTFMSKVFITLRLKSV